MKFLIISLAFIISILLGFFPKIDKAKSTVWKITAVLMMIVAILINILPPIATNLENAKVITSKIFDYPINSTIALNNNEATFDEANQMWLYHIKSSKKNKNSFNLYSKEKLDLLEKNEYIVKLKYDKNKNGFVFHSIISENPVFSIPYLPQLEERIKIMNFHVPMAWLTVLAYLISMIYSVNYLRKQDMFDDIKASSAAYLGTVFCILATLTGAVWAKYNWGSYWNWDPRQTSIFVLLLIYFAYFILRSSIENEKMRARLSSVYSIIAFVTVPFFIFILPRIASGLHPGSSSEDTIGPVLATKSDMLNPTMQFGFGISIIAFSMLFFWLINLHIRAKKMNE